jgi:fucose 4-O-acetylase-like acetyltransferase
MQGSLENTPVEQTSHKPGRLHYLDWLQVIAVLGVVLFHALFPFDDLVDWNIKNVEKSALATLYSVFFTPWGMAFFFLMAGTTSGFSLRRRTPERFIRERVAQLLIPFVIGCIVLTPLHAYYELTHRGWWKGNSIIEFVRSSEAYTYFYSEHHEITPGPETFSQMGYHLWFVAFLFLFSLIALPLFMWLKGDSGKRFVVSLARLAKRRGGLLVFVIPPMMIRFIFFGFTIR